MFVHLSIISSKQPQRAGSASLIFRSSCWRRATSSTAQDLFCRATTIIIGTNVWASSPIKRVLQRKTPTTRLVVDPWWHPLRQPRQQEFSSLQRSLQKRKGGSGGGGNNNNNKNSQWGGLPPYIWIAAIGTGGLIVYGVVSGLDRVPVTGRRRWIITSPQWEAEMGDAEYQALLKQFQGKVLPHTHRASITVHRVGSRIAKAAQQWTLEKQQQQQQSNTKNPQLQQEWQNEPQPQQPPDPRVVLQQQEKPYTYTVVRSDMANAFVLPGNHVFVMTGLFRYVHNEDELAAVLSHETAHNLARHAGERVSSHFLTLVLAQLAWLIDPSGVLAVYIVPAASTLLRDLPHSRQQETEADQIGVHLAALACFDPRAAPRVFANMAETPSSSSLSSSSSKASRSSVVLEPPEFLSTHPSHTHRIANFQQWLPEAMETFTGGDGRCQKIRQAMHEARRLAAFQAHQREAVQHHHTTQQQQEQRQQQQQQPSQ